MYLVVECSTMSAPRSQRLLQRRRGKGVVHQHLYVRRGSQLRDRADVGDGEQRVGGRLHPDQPGLRGDRRADRVEIGQRHRRVADAPLREHLVDQPEGAAIGVVGDDDVIAGPQQRAQRTVGGGHAGGERPPERGLLHRGQRRLQRRAGRVAGAGVLEPAAQPTDAVLRERRTGVDRRVDGAGARVGPESGVDGLGGQAPATLCCSAHHRSG